jgi:hypothetical protein
VTPVSSSAVVGETQNRLIQARFCSRLINGGASIADTKTT